jgi:NADH-quinone oxidoreductase subunit N
MAPAVLIGHLAGYLAPVAAAPPAAASWAGTSAAAGSWAGTSAAMGSWAAAPPADVISAPPIDLVAVMPVLIVLGAACVAVLFEAVVPRASRFYAQAFLAVAAILVAGVWTVIQGIDGRYTVTMGGSIAVDSATYVMWGALLVLALLAVPVMADRVAEPGGAFVADAAVTPGSTRDRRATAVAAPMQTEIFPLALFAVGGMLVFPAANDYLTLFVALEVLSLPLYILCGLARRRRLISQEAAVKYFLIGAFTSAILLYGIALLYGYSGSVRFYAVAQAARAGGGSDVLLLGGIALLVVGMLFKGSVGPFHLWTPDVYQGAPTPVTAFMASCTKFAAFAAMVRVLQVSLAPMVSSWRPVLEIVAAASMVIGAVLGITQTDIKRMLAYSSIAHAGFLLLGVMSLSADGATATLFYLLTYGIATIGGFVILTAVRRGGMEATHLSDWAGMGKRSPLLAATMTVFLLSYAGIPLTAGFIGKFVVFSAAMSAGMGVLVVVAMLATVITAFFYLRIIVMMYFSDPAPAAPAGGVTIVLPSTTTLVVIAVCVLLTVLLGIVPGPVLHVMQVGFPLLS